MRRLWLPLSIVVLLAACSSTQPMSAHRSSSYAAGHAYETRPPGFPDFVDHSVGREEISIEAMGLVGIPYRWGGNTPDSGFDCSGLVHYVLARAADVNLPRTTADMSTRGESIEPDEIAAGDLVFFNTTGRPHSHVGIYVGKLRFVDAPSTGGTVRIDYLNNPYWAKHFDGIRRVAPPRRAPTPFDSPTLEAAAPVAPAAAAPAVAMVPLAPAAAATPMAPPPSVTRDVAAEAAPPRDAFEPPPQAMSAAQRQALAAGAVSPPVESRTAPISEPAATATATPSAAPAIAAANAAPDPIDAAADAFEPPPPAAAAAAAAAARRTPAPTQSGDDPIARFANGSY
ncbi:MAG TPA: C40 family peptidase [Paraburkholderia sp.]|jgi:hypothetical protein